MSAAQIVFAPACDDLRALRLRLRRVAAQHLEDADPEKAIRRAYDAVFAENVKHEPRLELDELDAIVAAAAHDWPDLVRLDSVSVPPFPVDALPHWLRDWVTAVAVQTQTPPDLPGILGLAAVSTAVARKARIHAPTHTEPLNIYGVIALPPGSRKSEVYALARAPIAAYEASAAERMRPVVAEAQEQLAGLRQRLEAARKSETKEETRNVSASSALELARELASLEACLPRMPRYIVDDATPETVAKVLADQSGRLALWSPEASELFAMMGGRYSGNSRPNLGVYLQAHAGDALTVDRIKRESVQIERPALTIAAAIQPAGLRALRAEHSLRNLGLLGRFLYAIPEPTVGTRDVRNARRMPAGIEQAYREHLGALLGLSIGEHEAELHLTPEASELWYALSEELEPDLRPEAGRYAWMADWAAKLAGLVLRLAGLLHAAEWADQADPWRQPVDTRTMQSALELGRYALAHAAAALGMMHASAALEGASKAWRGIARRGLSAFRERELWQATKGGRFDSLADLAAALRVLEERGYVAVSSEAEAGGRRGRPRSALYLVNPGALGLADATR